MDDERGSIRKVSTGLVATLATVGIAGLVVPPLRRRPRGIEPGPPTGVVDVDGFPAPFQRYARAVFGDPVPSFGTAAIWGRAGLRPGGRGPWFRARAATYHELGHAFVADFPMTWFGIGLTGGRDAFVDGHGRAAAFGRPGPSSAATDRSANTFMWLEAGMWPETWHVDGVRLKDVDATTVRVWIPPHDEPITWRLGVDGMPTRLEALRSKVPDEPPVPQTIELGPWHDVDGMRFFSSATVTWADEGTPWLRWRIDGVVPGADVTPFIERTRNAVDDEVGREPALAAAVASDACGGQTSSASNQHSRTA
jgi:hypothetical protein